MKDTVLNERANHVWLVRVCVCCWGLDGLLIYTQHTRSSARGGKKRKKLNKIREETKTEESTEREQRGEEEKAERERRSEGGREGELRAHKSLVEGRRGGKKKMKGKGRMKER